MDYSDIKTGLEGFVERYDSQTYIGSYRETSRSSLLNDGLSTRANSLWKMAEYVVAKYDGADNSIEDYIKGWKQLASSSNNQFLLIEEERNSWGMYDAKGNRLGGDNFISDYFLKKKRKSESPSLSSGKVNSSFRPYVTAIKSKPFLLLAGISGTGKSRIVREMALVCWEPDSQEYKNPRPRNFEMVQVKPNWHDSSELIGYVSRVSGQAEYIAGDFLKFIVRAWAEKDIPYFLCLDEMNLAPVEQYFAEYLSIVESRKNIDGVVVTDPILPAAKMRGPNGVQIPQIWYARLIDLLLADCPINKEEELKCKFLNEGISLPPNLIVVGTVNMDETTFSFSRKVLDRAMTIEMNEVNLKGGLRKRHEDIGKLGAADLIGTAVEGVDVFEDYHDECKTTINYLQALNDVLEGTPFKIAYRTRNEFLLYVVNNLPYRKDDETEEFVIARALDEMTSMKILSRIEGDADKIGNLLEQLSSVIKEQLGDGFTKENSVSLKKLSEMENRLKSGYTSFWS